MGSTVTSRMKYMIYSYVRATARGLFFLSLPAHQHRRYGLVYRYGPQGTHPFIPLFSPPSLSSSFRHRHPPLRADGRLLRLLGPELAPTRHPVGDTALEERGEGRGHVSMNRISQNGEAVVEEICAKGREGASSLYRLFFFFLLSFPIEWPPSISALTSWHAGPIERDRSTDGNEIKRRSPRPRPARRAQQARHDALSGDIQKSHGCHR